MMRPSSLKKNKKINISSNKKDSTLNRQPVKTNQIIFADFSMGTNHFEKKKKRCPLWMLTKRGQKKSHQIGNIFTNQGITSETNCSKELQESASPKTSRISEKCKSSKSSKKSSLVPFNFVKSKAPKPVTAITDAVNQFPVFQYFPKSRYLHSALSERRPHQEDNFYSHKRSMSSKAQSAKKTVKKQVGELGAWNTIEVEEDDFI